MAVDDRTLAMLVEKAWEVGAILNTIEDDDAREQAQESFERTLNHELHCGSVNRRQFAPALRAMGETMVSSLADARLRRSQG